MSKHQTASDADLVAQVIAGDLEVYGELMQRYEAKLLRYVTYVLGGDYASADVVQETFIKAYTNLRSYKPKYSFSAWIYRIAHNTAINVAKKNKRYVAMRKRFGALIVRQHAPALSGHDEFADDAQVGHRDVVLQ